MHIRNMLTPLAVFTLMVGALAVPNAHSAAAMERSSPTALTPIHVVSSVSLPVRLRRRSLSARHNLHARNRSLAGTIHLSAAGFFRGLAHHEPMAGIMRPEDDAQCGPRSNQGWMGLDYINADCGAQAQGPSDWDIVYAHTLTPGQDNAPAVIELSTGGPCDKSSGFGACVYYMTGNINLPAGTELIVDGGVTLVDMNVGLCDDNDGGTTPENCTSNGNINVSGGTLQADPGSVLKFSNYNGSNAAAIVVSNGGVLTMNGDNAQPGDHIVLTSADTTHSQPNWGGITFVGGGNGNLKSSNMSWVDMSYAGGRQGDCNPNFCWQAAIEVQNASPTIQDSTIDHTIGNGIQVDGPLDNVPTLTGDTITNTTAATTTGLYEDTGTGWAVYYAGAPTDLSGVSGLSATGNTFDAVGIDDGHGAYGGTGTWQPLGTVSGGATMPIIIGAQSSTSDPDLQISNPGNYSGHLTIAAGTVLEFRGGAGLVVPGSSGILTINGTHSQPVALTGFSAAGSSLPSIWRGITFGGGADGSASRLSWADISYAGAQEGNCNPNFCWQAAIEVQNASPTIQDSTIDHATGNAVQVDGLGNLPALTDDTITNTTAVAATGLYEDRGSGWAVYYAGVPADLKGLSGLIATGNTFDGVGVDTDYGTDGGTGTWQLPGTVSGGARMPIVIGAQDGNPPRDLQFGGCCYYYGNLTIAAGTLLELDGNNISVGGGDSLTLNGTSSQPVSITSFKASGLVASGMRHSATGPSTPAAGDWGGVRYYNGAGGSMTDVHISYGGSNGQCVLIYNDSTSVTSSTIDNCSGNDVEVSNGGSPTLTGNNFYPPTNSTMYGVLNDNGGSTCDPTGTSGIAATSSYWGSATGPSGCGAGGGSKAGADVAYMPFSPTPVSGTPTLARLVHFTANVRAGMVVFHWRVASSHGIAGFNVFAGRHRLNARLIRTHRSSGYRYATRWTGRGAFSMQEVLTDGAATSLPGRGR